MSAGRLGRAVEAAVAARAAGRLEEARARLDEAVGLAPDPRLLELRSEVLSDLGHVEAAILDLDRLLAERPDARLHGLRAQRHLQRRNYRRAQEDLDAALRLAPADPGLLAKRAELFLLTDRLDEARADYDAAVAAAPGDVGLAAARLSLLARRGEREALEQAACELERAGGARGAGEAAFARGCLDFKERRPGLGEAHFRAASGGPRDEGLAMRARFYWTASRVLDPEFRRRVGMKEHKETGPRHLYLCGLGIFPPYTASLEVLHAIGRCDVLFNNVAGPEVASLLGEFCSDIRPASYQAWQDEPKWADRIFAELDKGRRVGFVTRGHPLVFGGLAVELLRRCRATETPFETFGAVSSIDHLLARSGLGLGDDMAGIQAFDRPAIEAAETLNAAQPLLACFYQGLSGAAVKKFRASLERFYPAGHECWMYGPKYDDAPVAVALGKLEKSFPEIHSSLMLFVPPRKGPRRA